MPRAPLDKRLLVRLSTIGFGAGVFSEFFMLNTGFYSIVTRKRAERVIEAEDAGVMYPATPDVVPKAKELVEQQSLELIKTGAQVTKSVFFGESPPPSSSSA